MVMSCSNVNSIRRKESSSTVNPKGRRSSISTLLVLSADTNAFELTRTRATTSTEGDHPALTRQAKMTAMAEERGTKLEEESVCCSC